jgi:hypothetical protein
MDGFRRSTIRPIACLIHGFVFAFGSAIILYGSIVDVDIFVPPIDVIPPVIFSLAAFFLLLLIAYLLTRNLESAGLIASLLVLGFFYLWSVFLAILLISVAALLLIKRFFKGLRYSDTHFVLNAISLAVVGFYLFRFIMMVSGQLWNSVPVTIQPIAGVPEPLPAQASTPDIYYIILDGYGRADMLQTIHGFDNSGLVDALKQRGFVVASQSQSNYPRTLLSLSSSLNMQYLDAMSSVMGDSDLWWPVKDTVHQSEVRRILEDRGYKTIFFANNWDYSDIRDGDFYEAAFPIQLNIFNSLFWNHTSLRWLAGIDRLGIADPSYDTHRRIILYDFATLPEVAAIQGPKFTFVHIIAPHPPYVFDHAGNPLDPSHPYTISVVDSRNGYIEQLQFVNQAILATIDGILANSEAPPVIIIQGDHGPATLTDVVSFKRSCLYERFSILNAYYLPGIDKSSIPMDISPVNSFRFIFNSYFKSDLELLPNKQYISTSTDFYKFMDVTGQTQEHCDSSSVQD